MTSLAQLKEDLVFSPSPCLSIHSPLWPLSARYRVGLASTRSPHKLLVACLPWWGLSLRARGRGSGSHMPRGGQQWSKRNGEGRRRQSREGSSEEVAPGLKSGEQHLECGEAGQGVGPEERGGEVSRCRAWALKIRECSSWAPNGAQMLIAEIPRGRGWETRGAGGRRRLPWKGPEQASRPCKGLKGCFGSHQPSDPPEL